MTQAAAIAMLTPLDFPPAAHPHRWPALQRLRRQPDLDPEPWVEAIEAATLPLEADLIAVLAPHLDGSLACRLFDCWLSGESREPTIPSLIGGCRDPRWAEHLRQRLAQASPQQQIVLLPLLGHQREATDFPLLRARLLDPGPVALRLAALEALGVGLSAWPLMPLRRALADVIADLQPALAAGAVDLLARLPGARADLLRLSPRPLDPGVASRLQRRLAALPAAPLLLLVHGRSGGRIPAELQQLASELEQRRGAAVQVHALSDPQPPRLPITRSFEPVVTLVPLLLLPGQHVRQDLPRLTAELRRQGPLRRLPFLGSWPSWQDALATEIHAMAGEANPSVAPQLLHHPLQGPLAERYLAFLARRCGVLCRPMGFDAAETLASLVEEASTAVDPVLLPLALAANRLTDGLQAMAPKRAHEPLLMRPRLRQVLLEALTALP